MTWSELKERARQALAACWHWILVAVLAVLAFYALMVLLYFALIGGIILLAAGALRSL